MASTETPIRLTFQSDNEPWDALASLALAPFVSGEEPFAESFRLTGVVRAADLVPLDSVRWSARGTDVDRLLARGSGWSVDVQRWRNGSAEVSVTAVDAESLAKAVADVRARSPFVEPQPETVDIDFWYGAGTCVRYLTRTIEAPAWDSISGNYPAEVRGQVGALAGMGTPRPGGRLLLWHGPPGTGKTTAIRALVRAWSTWCRALFVVDAERFLGAPATCCRSCSAPRTSPRATTRRAGGSSCSRTPTSCCGPTPSGRRASRCRGR